MFPDSEDPGRNGGNAWDSGVRPSGAAGASKGASAVLPGQVKK